MKRDLNWRLQEKAVLARLVIGFERLWLAAWPSVMVAGLAVLFVLSGIAGMLPVTVKFAFLGVLALAFLFALKSFWGLRLPSHEEGLRRIEERSGLSHRPVTAFHDRQAGTNPDPTSRAIWREHKKRLQEQLKNLKAGFPRSKVPAKDPFALRNALAIALIATAFLNGGSYKERIAETVSTTVKTTRITSLDAWIAPPAYTGKPPVLLTGEIARKRLAAGEAFLVPEGSTLVARVNGGGKPELVYARAREDGSVGEELFAKPLAGEQGAAVHEIKSRLVKPVRVLVRDGGRVLADWPVEIVPDLPPKASITGDITLTATGAFSVPWQASDDYGVASLKADIKLTEAKDVQGKGKTTGKPRALKYEPPSFPVHMRKLNPLKARGKAFHDLTEHPWAGLEVELRITATDQAGKKGISAPLVFKLPERNFRKLLARALIEQRRSLVRNPDDKNMTMRALSALMAWPDGLIKDSGVYLGMRHVTRQLYNARSDDEIKQVVKSLWEIAVSIEDGDLSSALKELDALRKELQKALAEGASPDRIAELMKQLREAMDRFMEAMQRQMQKALRNGDQMQNQRQRGGKEISSQDLKKMLDMIENLARSGARDAAQEMLSQLDNILKNLQPGIARQTDPQRTPPMARMLQQLSDMMRRQQQLMDQTFQLPKGKSGRGSQGQQNQSGKPSGPGDRRSEHLANQQDALGRMLEDLLKQLNDQGLNAPQSLNRSQQSMGDASGALRDRDSGKALGKQGDALDGLREGARNMAQQMMQQGTGNEGNYGRHGEARGENRDPLGRPMPRTGDDLGPDRNILPGEAAVQRAREILDALRERSNNPNRPRIELKYLDRLLRGLY